MAWGLGAKLNPPTSRGFGLPSCWSLGFSGGSGFRVHGFRVPGFYGLGSRFGVQAGARSFGRWCFGVQS